MWLERLKDLAANGLRWWVSGLLAWVPPTRWPRTLIAPPRTVRLTDLLDTDTDVAVSRGERIAICVDDALMIRHSIRLPFAGTRATSRMVEIQLTRILPIRRALLAVDWVVSNSQNASKELPPDQKEQEVAVIAVRREHLETAEARVLRGAGQLVGVKTEGDGQLRRLLPAASVRAENTRMTRAATLWVAALVAISLVPYAWLTNVVRTTTSMEAEVAAIRGPVTELLSAQAAARETEERLQYVDSAQAANQFLSALALLSELAPDDVYLRELEYEGRIVRISGIGESSASWALLLEQNAYVESATVIRASSDERIGNLENFDIEIVLNFGAGAT